MPTLEPNHYWPADRMEPKPAQPVSPEAATPALPGQHVTPFEMAEGQMFNGNGSDFLFDTTFFEIDPAGVPDPKAIQSPPMDPETTRQSLGE